MASRAEVKLFTIRAANRAVAELTRTLPVLRKIFRDIERIESRLEVLDLICNRSVASDNPDLQAYLRMKVRYHRTITEFEGMLRHLESQGYLLRDLEEGIVHFLGKRRKKTVLLCWREGEKHVSHWHAIERNRLPEEEKRRAIDNRDEF